jgi:hypothetical protein
VTLNRNKRSGRFQKSKSSNTKRVKVCFPKGRSSKKRSTKKSFVCNSKTTGRFVKRKQSGACRKGSKRTSY